MAYSYLTFSIDTRGVASVFLNRPDVHNAFDDVLIAEVTQLFSELDAHDQVRFAILSGNGKSFCAGGDLNWMRGMKAYSREENIADSKRLCAMYETLHRFSKPLIAIVHGAALGGGSGLAAVCDFVVAAEDAKFGFTETRLGILPAVISSYAMEKIGISAARAYFISGMQFSAATAKDIGLVHRVVPAASLEAERAAITSEFLKAAPEASRKAKALIRTLVSAGNDTAAITTASINAIADARVSAEGQDGMNALLTRSKPGWIAS